VIEVEDAQTASSDRELGAALEMLVIRTSVRERVEHVPHRRNVAGTEDATYAAHS